MAINYQRLRAAIEHSERHIAPFRSNRYELVKNYCGSDYGALTEERPMYLPVIHQAADTYCQVLVADRPRALVTTRHPELKWFSKHFERALNNHIAEIRLEEELRMAVLEAFFCIGVMKVYFGDSPQLHESEDEWIDPGWPYAEHLSLDNFGFDVNANSWRKIQYAYDKYSIPRDQILSDSRYKKIHESVKASEGRTPHDGYTETVASLTASVKDTETEFIPTVQVMDVWVPGENKIVTMLADSDNPSAAPDQLVLREIEWEGPEGGPYHILSFSDTPDNIVGVSPGMKLRRLGDLLNSLYRKQVNQARRQRDLPIFEAQAEGDVSRIRGASDGQWTRVRNRDSVGVLKMGGVDPSNQQFSMAVLDMYDRMAGNLQAMAGLGSQADTLGQDQIIQATASRLQSKMQGRVVEFTANIMRDLGWLLWNDKAREIGTEYEIPGTGMRATSNWTPEHREGNFLQYNFEIEPYSMQFKSPSQRANALLTYVSQIAVPMLQIMMQQGGNVDFKALTEHYSELLDLPRLKEIVTFNDAQAAMQPQPEPPPGGKPPTTTRTHVRNNVSAGTAQDRSGEMQKVLGELANAASAQPQVMGAQ